jgi:AmiR/NasT family two-component response regulator
LRRESHLLEALQTRELIGQGIGIVMERYGLRADRAFDYLSRVSQSSNTKLRDVAADLVGQASAGEHHLPDHALSVGDSVG